MMAFTTILRFICILISLYGMSVFIQKRAKIAYAFCMSITCSLIVSILFLFSLFMKITVSIWILGCAGIILFVVELIRKEIHRDDILNWTNLFLLIGTIILLIYLPGKRFAAFDDFSHWGPMARHLIESQTLPTEADPLITFTSYPPGTALWICFVSTLTGGATEDVYLLAQAFWILAFVSTLTCFDAIRDQDQSDGFYNKNNNQRTQRIICIGLFILISALCAVIMTYGAKILALYVDGILGAAGFSGVAFLLLSKDSVAKKALWSIPLMISPVLIKTHGLFYAASMVVVLVYLAVRERKEMQKYGRPSGSGKRVLAILGSVAAVVIAELLWLWHVKIAFPNSSDSLHSISLSRWISVFEGRGMERSSAIIKGFFDNLFVWYLLLFIIVIIVVYLVIFFFGVAVKHKGAKRSMWMLIFSLVHLLVYLGGMLFVYLFSMEDFAADNLNSFGRYLGVEFTCLAGLCVAYLIKLFGEYDFAFEVIDAETDQEPNNAHRLQTKSATRQAFAKKNSGAIRIIPLIVADVIAIAFIVALWGGITHFRSYHGSSREWVNTLSADANYEGDVLFYAPSVTSDWFEQELMKIYGSYDFRSLDMETAMFQDGDVETKYARHTHLLIYEVDQQLVDFLRSQGWTGDIEPGLYDIATKSRVGGKTSIMYSKDCI